MRRFLQTLFRSDRPTAPANRSVRLGLDRLDDRLVPAQFAFNSTTGVLAISGDDLPDNVYIFSSSDWSRYVDVWVNGTHAQYDRIVQPITRIQCSLGGGFDTFQNDTNIPSVVNGGRGNDTIIGGTGWNILDGGEDDDYLEARAPFVDNPRALSGTWLYGGPGNDTIIGSDRPDYIDAGDGNDTVHGDHPVQEYSPFAITEYGDIILGGAGNDTIFGYRGNDNINGGTGADNLFGGNGYDLLDAGSDFDRDWLSGGPGVMYIDRLVMYEYQFYSPLDGLGWFPMNWNYGTLWNLDGDLPNLDLARRGTPMYSSFDAADPPTLYGDWQRNLVYWRYQQLPTNLASLSLATDVFSPTTSTTQTLSTSSGTTLSTYTYQGTGSIWAG